MDLFNDRTNRQSIGCITKRSSRGEHDELDSDEFDDDELESIRKFSKLIDDADETESDAYYYDGL